MTKTLSLFAASALLFACGESPKPSTPADTSTASATPPAASATPEARTTPAASATPSDASEKKYRLVVSFISKGQGIDQKAREHVVRVFDKWRIERGAELKTVRPHWGKEGEMDVCSELAELKDDERGKFIGEVKAEAAKSDRVTVSENAACHPENK